ncbi:MAG: hypothetical protein QHI48_01075 [Bacteroidota bacterium]|nr:hypothetical protein [Bacteroidota bacterium]
MAIVSTEGNPFTPELLERIADVLGGRPRSESNGVRFELCVNDPIRRLTLEIYPRILIGESEGALVCVYTPTSVLQLQHCSGVVVSEMLGEVTFVAECGGKLSGLIVEKGGGCSLYANVDRSLLSGDFTKLGPEVMMSGLALSLTEPLLPDDDDTAPRDPRRP